MGEVFDLIDRVYEVSTKEGGFIHTEYHVTVVSRLGYVTATAFPNREEAECFMASERKKKNVSKVTMDTMLVSDAMDRFQLRPLKRKENEQ